MINQSHQKKLLVKPSGKVKPGTYDLLISIGISGQTHKVWLENFLMKPDINYKIATNLNAGGISYIGGNKDVKAMHLYPAGSAGRQTGTPAPIKNLETISYDNVTVANCCSPGHTTFFLNLGMVQNTNGEKILLSQQVPKLMLNKALGLR